VNTISSTTGTIIVHTSSFSPFDTQSLGRELAAHELTLVDAPITQTYMHATDAGESTLMVGADSDEIFEAVKPVLSDMAGYLFHMGPLGSGHAMKTLNNYIMASGICALNDSLVTGQKWGLDPQKMIDVLNVGTGVCFPTLDTFRRDALPRTFNSGFGLALLVKDLGITQDFMQHSEFKTGLPELLRGYLGDALECVGPRADHTESMRRWEKRAGFGVKKTEKVQKIPEKDFKHRLEGINREL
jgi:3-hydroxyisobutyrate dehydrogenase-like beta-hydroxyacid dehydrogenase